MDEKRARALLSAERARVQALLDETTDAARNDRDVANEPGNYDDPAERLTAELGDDAVAAQLRDRLVAIERAERRIDEGTYGRSIRSGASIPDDRLEADPAAELTEDEARQS
jgi:DnaK suppressor protein